MSQFEDKYKEMIEFIKYLSNTVEENDFQEFHQIVSEFLDERLLEVMHKRSSTPLIGGRDTTGDVCTACYNGRYVETSVADDLQGVLHCNKCGAKTMRWNYERI